MTVHRYPDRLWLGRRPASGPPVRVLGRCRRAAKNWPRAWSRRGISIAPHNIAGPVGTAFAAQISSTWPNFLALEYHAQDVPFFNDIVDRPIIQNACIQMTDAPGIGVEVDLEQVRKWSKHGEQVFDEPPRRASAAY